MRWKGRRRSSNVEDLRGQDTGYTGASSPSPALLKLAPLLIGSKWGRILLIGGVAVYFGSRMLGVGQISQAPPDTAHAPNSATMGGGQSNDEVLEFVEVVLADTEDAWHKVFSANGMTYKEPTLRIFERQVNSACGMASAAMGPFYCPADQIVYLDLSFFNELAQRHDAPGDFAAAYVIAHEIGHHVQNLLGVGEKVARAARGQSTKTKNSLSVMQELQADCFAGVWGYAADKFHHLLEAGDTEEAIRAAAAIGDDRLQRESAGRVVPDSFTHGSSKQRVRWFGLGFTTGDINACDTFSQKARS